MNGSDNRWRLAREAFLSWKRFGDAERSAYKAGDKDRQARLLNIKRRAWKRYQRRWVDAKSSVERNG